MYKKLLPILTAAFCLFFFSCSNSMFMNYMNYNQKPGSSGGGNSGGSGGDNFEEEPENTQGIKISANFKYILPNGEIDMENYKGNLTILPSHFSPAPSFNTQDLKNKVFYLSVINGQIPVMHFKAGTWQASSGTGLVSSEYFYKGSDFPVTGQVIPVENKNVTYYKYQGKNPKYVPLGFYNTAGFTRDDGFSETVMNRFNFYRWTGKNTGGDMDTYMLAVDTYTRLTFVAFKIPEGGWNSVMGEYIPNNFVPIERYAASGGVFYNFYEYDPCGYVDADGNIILETWYKETTDLPVPQQVPLMPPRTGKSPYYNDGSDEIDAGLMEGGSPVTGTFTIKPSLSVTGTDAGTAKFELGSFWGNGSKNETFKPVTLAVGEVDLSTTGEKNEFSPKEHIANSVTTDMILLLGGNITHVKDGTESDISTFKAEDAYKLKYNRLKQKWEHESGFSLGHGEEKTIDINVPNSKLKMSFIVKWESRYSVTDNGKVLLAAVDYKGADPQIVVSGYGSKYMIEYTDTDYDSAEKDKPVEFELAFYNLDDAKPITVYYQPPAVQGFVNKVMFDGITAVKRGGNLGITPVRLSMTLGCSPQDKQQQVIAVKLLYPSTGFDMTYSPKEITITVKRRMR